MAGFKAPDFAERAKLAQEAKQRALDKLRARPAADPAVVQSRIDAAAAKETAKAEREAAEAAAAKPLTPEEQKAIRDAKYAARKARRR